MTDREIDAKLAEAIGCKPVWEKWNRDSVEAWHCECMALNYVHGDKRRQAEIHTYYSAPTWVEAGQIKVALTVAGWHIQVTTTPWPTRVDRVNVLMTHVETGETAYAMAQTLEDEPKAIALAACKALGIETE